jgi:hypothetical protein
VTFFGEESSLLQAIGVGGQAGILFKPVGDNFRIGAHFQSPIVPRASYGPSTATTPEGDRVVQNESGSAVFLPDQLYSPFRVTLGAAISLGPRPLNPEYLDPRALVLKRMRERGPYPGDFLTERAWKEAWGNVKKKVKEEVERDLRKRRRELERFGVLVSLQADFIGPSDAFSWNALVRQRVEQARMGARFAPHLGSEIYAIPSWFTLRAGTYMEPPRYVGSTHRVHATAGFDWKLLEWGVFGLLHEETGWRLSGALDYARDYLNASIGLGTWQ